MLTLRGLQRLCTTYVPRASRHPNSTGLRRWWAAHELGHLLVARPAEIGQPMFGYDVAWSDDARWIRTALLVECAAMSVSRRFLTACGRADLAREEIEDTDHSTLTWWDDHRQLVRRFMAQRGVARVPCTHARLETVLRHKVTR